MKTTSTGAKSSDRAPYVRSEFTNSVKKRADGCGPTVPISPPIGFTHGSGRLRLPSGTQGTGRRPFMLRPGR
jgi:hypothetical protein